ncbi:MAG: response regulator [Inhella sp.]|uniref:response regulator n=1 Tax=Inhella sp. TaxID=1921806 RepID=UPI0022C91619|nr:response regulator [Inhella sp.]MCZ8235923.1 response regulator [Inhella sp.]
MPLSLRLTLPLGLLAVLLVTIAISFAADRYDHRTLAAEQAEADLTALAEHLARTATWELSEHPQRVGAEVSMAATDLRAERVLVLDGRGTVLASNHLAMEGRPAAEVVPGFDPTRFAQAARTRQPVRWDGPGHRKNVALSFQQALQKSDARLRNLEQGVVWATFDYSAEWEDSSRHAAIDLLPIGASALLVSLLLGLVLRHQVTRPLALIGSASQELAEAGRLSHQVPEVGPAEIRQLARRFNTMAQDIARAQADSESQRARVHALVDSAMDAIITIDADQRILSANRAAAHMFGVPMHELVGRPLDRLLPERFRAAHAGMVRRFGQSGVTNRMMAAQTVVRGLRANGEEFPGEGTISHSRVDGQDFYTVILRDVTERQRSEEAIRALNASLENTVAERTASLQATAEALSRERDRLTDLTEEVSLILDSATVGILLLKDRRVVRANAKAEELFGYAPSQAIGRTTREWYDSQESYEQVGREMHVDLAAGRMHLREMQMQRQNGQRFWARISARHLARRGQTLVVAIVEDLSAEHAADEALAEAKAQADAANAAKSRFLANMSHEIRTPMNAIIGMTHLALRTSLTEQQRDYLHKIQLSSQHLLGVINDILDFSKVEANKLSLEHIEFQLLPVLDNVFTLMGNKAVEKGLELVLDCDPSVPNFLVGDPLRLGQVLVNLGNNAVKFTERGDVVVRVSLMAPLGERVALRFEVRDTGVGLSETQRAQLFQSFHQADASTSRHYGGTGLGLAISQRLVHLMGGEIGVDSTPGQGSTFWFTAVFDLGATQALPGDPLVLKGRRVLAVDDNEAARQVMQRLLHSLGLEADVAADGDQAVQAVQAAQAQGRPYEVVLLDWSMPRMDGLEAGRQIRALDPSAAPRLMLITGRGRDEVLREALENGFSTVMVKPVNASALLDNLLLSLSPSSAPAPQHLSPEPAAAAPVHGRALVVEDNAINQQIAREMLQDLGLTVEIAQHGQEALDRLAQEPAFDLIFMDVHMPVMDGFTATRALRRDPRWAQVPVIAMTANVLAEDRERCTASGMNDFVPKPVDVNALAAAVRRWLPSLPTGTAPPIGPVPVANDPRLAPLQRIQGLDVRAGLRRCGHKPELYLELLGRFVAAQPATLAELQQLGASLRGGAGPSPDVEPLRLKVHSLKGVAGNLGATLLHTQCEAMERRLRDDPRSAGNAIGVIESTTLALGDALREALGVAPSMGGDRLDPTLLRGALSTLADFLRDGDPDALTWCEQHPAEVQQALGLQAGMFQARVRQFEFADALALLTPHLKPDTP